MADFVRPSESHDLCSELLRDRDLPRLPINKAGDLELLASIPEPSEACVKLELDTEKPGSEVRFE